MLLRFLTIISLMSFSICRADLQEDLNNFYNSFGSSTHVDSADIYNGQKAGYATGGGISVRNRVMNTQPLTVNLPKFESGCGGIDLFAGGFSFIDSDKLVQNLKYIATNAKGYAFFLSMEALSPMVSQNIKQLQSWANTINGLSINSCEIGSQLVGSVWPRKTLANEQVCKLTKVNGLLSEHINARHDCATVKNQRKEINENENYIFVDEYNVGWEAIRHDPEFAKRKELAELVMTLMGTVVTIRNNSTPRGLVYPSKISDDFFLGVLLEGGSTNVYNCGDEKQCLTIKLKELSIKNEDSWIGKVRTKLNTIQNHILEEKELAQADIDFLARSSLPLYKIVNVLSFSKKGYCPLDLHQVAELVAMDMLIQYLRESIERVREGCQSLKLSQLYANEIDEYLSELTRVEEKVRYYETRTMRRKEKEMQIIEKIELFEKQLASQFILY